MISFKLRCFTSIALISFLMGFMSAIILMNGCQDKKPASSEKMQKLKVKAVVTSKMFTDSVNRFEAKAAGLSSAIARQKKLLHTAQLKAAPKQKIKTISGRIGFPARDLLKKTHRSAIIVEPLPGSLGKATSECDRAHYEKDSLAALIISSQDSLLTLKDSVITVLKAYNQNQADIISSAFTLHEELIIENNQLHKQLKRQKRKGKLLAILTGIISGVGVHQITNR